MIEAIRIWDYIKDVTWMDDSYTNTIRITFSINLDTLPVNNMREVNYVIKEIATKYGGKIYNEIDLYGEGNILNIECTVEGCDRLEKSNAIVGKIRDSLFSVRKDLPIDANYIGTTPVYKGGYVVQIIIYNTIKKETCDEINKLIKDFQGKEMNGDKARVHSDFEPTCINAVFKSQDAAKWFYKTIKLIEELG